MYNNDGTKFFTKLETAQAEANSMKGWRVVKVNEYDPGDGLPIVYYITTEGGTLRNDGFVR